MNKYIKYIKKHDKSQKSTLQIILFNPSFKIMFWYKIAHYLYIKKLTYIAYIITNKLRKKYAIDIHPACTIGKNLLIDHAVGIVIGETTIIKDNCIIYQGVTLGAKHQTTNKRHPTIGNNCIIGCNATILGNITIGDNSKIGANSLVIHDILPNTTIISPLGKVLEK